MHDLAIETGLAMGSHGSLDASLISHTSTEDILTHLFIEKFDLTTTLKKCALTHLFIGIEIFRIDRSRNLEKFREKPASQYIFSTI